MISAYNGADRRLAYLFENATEVSAEQILTTGTPAAKITVDGTEMTIYAPAGGGGGSVNAYDGTSAPNSGVGDNGDIYFQGVASAPAARYINRARFTCGQNHATAASSDGLLPVNNFKFLNDNEDFAWPAGTSVVANKSVYSGTGHSVDNFITNGNTYFQNVTLTDKLVVVVALPQGTTVDLGTYPKYSFKDPYHRTNKRVMYPVDWMLEVSDDGGATYSVVDTHPGILPDEQNVYTQLIYDDSQTTYDSLKNIFFKKGGVWAGLDLGHHYSLFEQWVGTWVDGSDLYEITVATGESVPSGGTLVYRTAMVGFDVLLYTK